MFKFEELRVYQEALLLVDLTYKVTNKWPKDEIFGLISQFRRAAVSISLNIAEGSSRTKKDFRHFLDMARGSCYECAGIILIARKRNYLTDQEFNELYEFCQKLAKNDECFKKLFAMNWLL
jgi:four helix bundle protein